MMFLLLSQFCLYSHIVFICPPHGSLSLRLSSPEGWISFSSEITSQYIRIGLTVPQMFYLFILGLFDDACTSSDYSFEQ